jgi:hypothetical protein
LDLTSGEADHRRVLAVLRFLGAEDTPDRAKGTTERAKGTTHRATDGER